MFFMCTKWEEEAIPAADTEEEALKAAAEETHRDGRAREVIRRQEELIGETESCETETTRRTRYRWITSRADPTDPDSWVGFDPQRDAKQAGTPGVLATEGPE